MDCLLGYLLIPASRAAPGAERQSRMKSPAGAFNSLNHPPAERRCAKAVPSKPPWLIKASCPTRQKISALPCRPQALGIRLARDTSYSEQHFSIFHRAMSVSYTHLDVYKRQAGENHCRRDAHAALESRVESGTGLGDPDIH